MASNSRRLHRAKLRQVGGVLFLTLVTGTTTFACGDSDHNANQTTGGNAGTGGAAAGAPQTAGSASGGSSGDGGSSGGGTSGSPSSIAGAGVGGISPAGGSAGSGGTAGVSGTGGQAVVTPPIDLGLSKCAAGGPIEVSFAATAPNIDGDLSDWAVVPCWSYLEAPTNYIDWDPVETQPVTANDLSGYVAFQYAADTLYVAAAVVDDIHRQTQATADVMWNADSLQIAFDMAGNGGTAYDTTDDFEYGWGLATSGPLTNAAQFINRWAAPAGALPFDVKFKVVREEPVTRYEIAVPAADLGVASFPAAFAHVSWLINDDDTGLVRRGWLELTPGIGFTKTPASYLPLSFDAEGSGGAGGAGGQGGAGG